MLDISRYMLFVLSAAILLSLSACSLHEINRQLDIVDTAATITGRVKIASPGKQAVKVFLYKDEGNGTVSLFNQFSLIGEGKYTFYIPAGHYLIAAFIDSNGDEKYKIGEFATYYGIENNTPSLITVSEKEEIHISPLVIKGAIEDSGTYKETYNLDKTNEGIGKIVSLNDPMFSDEFASMGLWRPLDFVDQVGGGLFFLNEYQASKIPIIFVHGINDSGRAWSEIVKNLDNTHFQPFIFYYPSGARLDMVSNYLVKAINTLYSRHHFKEFYVIAHSMGGLVSRSFIMKHYQNRHPAKIKLFMTVNSPMGGIPGANTGVTYSPIVVPAWRDVASESAFIKTFSAWKWPKEIPYHLVFSYESGEGDDGVVPLESQIPLKLQSESTRMYGFNSSHTDLLYDDQFITRLNKILAETLMN